MKRMLPLLLCLLLLLTSCTSAPDIENHAWQMINVQRADDGTIIYAASEDIADVPQLVLSCTAEDGTLTLLVENSGQTFRGSYFRSEESAGTKRYVINLEGIEGTATTGWTSYANGMQIPTLIIELNGHVLNYQGN